MLYARYACVQTERARKAVAARLRDTIRKHPTCPTSPRTSTKPSSRAHTAVIAPSQTTAGTSKPATDREPTAASLTRQARSAGSRTAGSVHDKNECPSGRCSALSGGYFSTGRELSRIRNVIWTRASFVFETMPNLHCLTVRGLLPMVRVERSGPRLADHNYQNSWWGGWDSSPRPADYENYALDAAVAVAVAELGAALSGVAVCAPVQGQSPALARRHLGRCREPVAGCRRATGRRIT
jgi:hypothetical protein